MSADQIYDQAPWERELQGANGQGKEERCDLWLVLATHLALHDNAGYTYGLVANDTSPT